MEKIYVENLAMIITDRCNLDCAHCLRGCKRNIDMSDEIIEATLGQIRSIGNLAINGGEPALVIDKIEKLLNRNGYIFNVDVVIKTKVSL